MCAEENGNGEPRLYVRLLRKKVEINNSNINSLFLRHVICSRAPTTLITPLVENKVLNVVLQTPAIVTAKVENQ